MPILKAVCQYKKVGDCPLLIDAYPANSEKKSPAILYIHGGALISGTRGDIGEGRVKWYHDAGFTPFAVDYRLSPQTKLPAIVEDIADSLAWLRDEGARLFNIDTDRIGIVGSSGGGYLALHVGTFSQKPRVIVTMSGYGDILGDWYLKPSEVFRTEQAMLTEEQAYKIVGDPEKIYTEGERGKFYTYCRQQGIWTAVVSGFDVVAERDKILPYCPAYHVGKDYPPTFLIHGDADTDVPYEQSVQMAGEFKKHGVPYQFATIHGAGHGYGSATNPDEVRQTFDQAMVFLKKYLYA
jgi:acetyl esterase/lipase